MLTTWLITWDMCGNLFSPFFGMFCLLSSVDFLFPLSGCTLGTSKTSKGLSPSCYPNSDSASSNASLVLSQNFTEWFYSFVSKVTFTSQSWRVAARTSFPCISFFCSKVGSLPVEKNQVSVFLSSMAGWPSPSLSWFSD